MQKIKVSIRVKIVLGILIMVLVLSTAIVSISYMTYKKTMDEHYETMGNNLAKTAISFLDAEEIKGYIAGIKEADPAVMEGEAYQRTLGLLRRLREANDVMYLYMIYPEEEGSYYIFDSDESEDACPYGYFMEYYEGSFKEHLDEILRGGRIPALISNEDFGWIISISYPYKDEAGEMLGYVCADISMDEVVRDRQAYLFNTMIILSVVTLLFAVVYYILCNQFFVKPIKQMANAATDFVSSDQSEEGTLSSSISSMEVKSRDELGLLCGSLKEMENNILGYIRNMKEITAERERVETELGVATQIQKSMLPCIFPAFPDREEFDIYASMTPAREVGGDFYDFFMVDRNHLAIVVADVSGKGVPAALFMVIGKTLIKDHTSPEEGLDAVFTEVNRLLCESNSEGLFITAFEGVLDLRTGEFSYVNAGHEIPFFYREKGAFEPYKIRAGFVLAGMEGMRYRSGRIQLEEGDKIFQYTDGVTEATDSQNQLYGMERLTKVLNENKDRTPREILENVKADIDGFVGDAPQFDDITMLCLTFKKRAEEDRE